MCDDLTPEECPECDYGLPDEHDIDPDYEMGDPDRYRDEQIAWDMELNR